MSRELQPALRLVAAADETEADWIAEGRKLGEIERAVMWEIGDWWNRGERYGRRVAIVTAPDWDGPAHETIRNAARVCARFDVSRRRDTLSFSHHAEIAALPPAVADRILDEAERQIEETGEPPPSRVLRAAAKKMRRAEREQELAETTAAAAVSLGRKLYGVIYADPPWSFAPYSRETGMDRAADNHYPTMTLDAIKAIEVPAAADCVLFLWATAPMLRQALDVMDAWGFEYKSHFVWFKDRAGTGYWNRNRHELLLVGTRGSIPAPAPGTQYESVIGANRLRHSEKPHHFREMIEEMFPTVPRLEMFARERLAGWDAWGNETTEASR
jgi:N6-adenosine-specific RNA methylase IME4